MQIGKNREVENHLLGKRSTITATLSNGVALYYTNVTVGTPGQPIQLQIDTGSSDVWIPSSSAALCKSAYAEGCPQGSFDHTKSSTFKVTGQNEFNISYVDGSGASGDYFQDKFTIERIDLNDFEMALAKDTTIGMGIAGIAYSSSEALVVFNGLKQYPNLVESMVKASLITTEAYSLWLDDVDATTGSLLFGGIDTAKFTGSLTSLHVYADARSSDLRPNSFTVAFTGLSATSPTGTDTFTADDFAEPVILDSGTSLTLLPDELAATIYQELGATYVDYLDNAIVPCKIGKVNGTLNFSFGGPGGAIIKVPVSQMLYEELTDRQGRPQTYPNGDDACILGIQPAGNKPLLFGDTFLRSAYVVYDLHNDRIGIAQTNFDGTRSNIVEFASHGAAIPSATTAPHEPSVTQTVSGIVGNGDSTTMPITSTAISQGATGTGVAVAGFQQTASPTSKSGAARGANPFINLVVKAWRYFKRQMKTFGVAILLGALISGMVMFLC